MKVDTKNWYVFYTKSRHEKKVKELLERRGYEVFLPMQKVMRQWSDRKKKVEVPLFNSYIFVNTEAHQIQEVVQIPGISWNIRHNGKPAILHEKEIDIIERFLKSGLLLNTQSLEKLETGDQVKVIDGPLRGMVGSLVATAEGNKFMVALDSIGQSLRVTLEPNLIKKVT